MKADRDFKYGDVLWAREKDDAEWRLMGMFVAWNEYVSANSFHYIQLHHRSAGFGQGYVLYAPDGLSPYWEVVNE